jgi:GNAT superfamily N-acetyltransferase
MLDFHLRQAEPEDRFALARIIIDATHSAFRGRVPNKCLNWLGPDESAINWGRTIENLSESFEHLYVAELANLDVAGFALAGRRSAESVADRRLANAYPTELISMHIDPVWHGKGLGRTLVRHMAGLLLDGGSSNLLVRVLMDNPNLPFYQRLGAKPVATQPYDWEGYATEEVILVWNDLQVLAGENESRR